MPILGLDIRGSLRSGFVFVATIENDNTWRVRVEFEQWRPNSGLEFLSDGNLFSLPTLPRAACRTSFVLSSHCSGLDSSCTVGFGFRHESVAIVSVVILNGDKQSEVTWGD